jgi:prepilin-type N-terminal cleavage/methylation domain-containing protein
MNRNRVKQARGFNTLELAIVLAVISVLLAIAVPQVMSAIYMAQVRGAAIDLSGLIQQARIMAERQNTTLPVYAGTVETNATGAFIGVSGAAWASVDPDVPYANGATNAAASSAPSALNPGFTAEAAGTVLYFSPRGLPVKSSGLTYVASNGVIFYVTDTHNDWCAVSVSGAGRSKVWTWSGSAWH